MSLARALRAAFGRTLLQQSRLLSTTPRAAGLEEFFDTPVKEGEKVTSGEYQTSCCHSVFSHLKDFFVRTEGSTVVTFSCEQGELGRLQICA
jgi:hypothetical protein